jgi:hypothetical protein
MVATFVYASSQGQRTHSAWTNSGKLHVFLLQEGNYYYLKEITFKGRKLLELANVENS